MRATNHAAGPPPSPLGKILPILATYQSLATAPLYPISCRGLTKRERFPTSATMVTADTTAAATKRTVTIAAFLACLDALVRRGLERPLEERTEILYISPLKALSNDVHRN